jgi:hypothetical protein
MMGEGGQRAAPAARVITELKLNNRDLNPDELDVGSDADIPEGGLDIRVLAVKGLKPTGDVTKGPF